MGNTSKKTSLAKADGADGHAGQEVSAERVGSIFGCMRPVEQSELWRLEWQSLGVDM